MSGRRLAATTLAMGVIALAFGALSPYGASLQAAISHPQQMADAEGPDAVVLAWATLLTWVVWSWGALGLALTAASALPGLVGWAARLLLKVVLPGAARARGPPRPGRRGRPTAPEGRAPARRAPSRGARARRRPRRRCRGARAGQRCDACPARGHGP